ncbi:MAG: hypothetical protein ACOY40_08940 [Bacillota bacterium]
MELTCYKCGYTAEYFEFTYLCKNGCPACGESDLRQCPKCGNECVFSRTEALEKEINQIKELAAELAAISPDDKGAPEKAKKIIIQLNNINRRWNDPELKKFLLQKQKELKLGVYARN